MLKKINYMRWLPRLLTASIESRDSMLVEFIRLLPRALRERMRERTGGPLCRPIWPENRERGKGGKGGKGEERGGEERREGGRE